MGSPMAIIEVEEPEKPATFKMRVKLLLRLKAVAKAESLEQGEIVNAALQTWLEDYDANGLKRVVRKA